MSGPNLYARDRVRMCHTLKCEYHYPESAETFFCSICRKINDQAGTPILVPDYVFLTDHGISSTLIEAAKKPFVPLSEPEIYDALPEAIRVVDCHYYPWDLKEKDISQGIPLYSLSLAKIRVSEIEECSANVAIVSWKWDITNKVSPKDFWNQRSKILIIALKKAAEKNIRYLMIDAITLDQFPQLDSKTLFQFCSFYKKIPVITTYEFTGHPEHDSTNRHFGVRCWSYPPRAWLLFEASRYLRNPRVTLDVLLTLKYQRSELPWKNDEMDQGAVCFFVDSLMQPYTMQYNSDAEPAFFHPQLMPAGSELFLPITQQFLKTYRSGSNSISDQEKQFSYVLICCERLLNNTLDNFVSDIDDMIRMNVVSLCSEEMGLFVVSLGNLVGGRQKRLIYFLALHLLCSMHIQYRMLEYDYDGIVELECLFEIAQFRRDRSAGYVIVPGWIWNRPRYIEIIRPDYSITEEQVVVALLILFAAIQEYRNRPEKQEYAKDEDLPNTRK